MEVWDGGVGRSLWWQGSSSSESLLLASLSSGARAHPAPGLPLLIPFPPLTHTHTGSGAHSAPGLAHGRRGRTVRASGAACSPQSGGAADCSAAGEGGTEGSMREGALSACPPGVLASNHDSVNLPLPPPLSCLTRCPIAYI